MAPACAPTPPPPPPWVLALLLLLSPGLFYWPLFQPCHWALPLGHLWSHVLYPSGLVLLTAGPSLSPRPLQPRTGQKGGREDNGLSWPMHPLQGVLVPSLPGPPWMVGLPPLTPSPALSHCPGFLQPLGLCLLQPLKSYRSPFLRTPDPRQNQEAWLDQGPVLTDSVRKPCL